MPETNTPAERNRLQIGIALAGGGPLGGIYEVGALMALDEALRGFRLTDSGVFVGVSSGAFFASGLANGLSPRAMHRMFIESDKDDDPFEPEVLLRPAFGEYGRRIAAIPRLLTSGLADYLRGGHNRKAAASLRRLVQALPAGLFDSAPLQAYLRRLASSRGFPDDFRKLRRKLYIVATDLDSSRACHLRLAWMGRRAHIERRAGERRAAWAVSAGQDQWPLLRRRRAAKDA